MRKRTESQYLLLLIYLREFNTIFTNFKKRSRVSSFLCAKICQIYILTDIKLSYLTFKSHSYFFCLPVFNFLCLRGIMFPVVLSGKIYAICYKGLLRFYIQKSYKNIFFLPAEENIFPDVISHIMQLQFATASPRATFPFVFKRKTLFVQTKQN